MASRNKMFRFFALSAALGQATASFNLNTGDYSWAYTTKDLANTTSQTCKDAYSANIDCDYTLQEIVASMSPDFDPTTSEVDAMCSTTCSDSLTEYVKNVKAACDQDGDLAGVASGNNVSYDAPVAIVGEVFQYAYAQACAKNGTGYCPRTLPSTQAWDEGEFSCSDKCSILFFQNAHNLPGSAYIFNYYALVTQSSWWEEVFSNGWKTVVKCGYGSSASTTASPTDLMSLAESLEIPSETGTASSNAAASTTVPAGVTTTAAPARSQVSSEVASTTATNGASRPRPFLF